MHYVSFQEALKASEEGKIVKSWFEHERMPYNVHRHQHDQLSDQVIINKFVLKGDELTRFNELKWSIVQEVDAGSNPTTTASYDVVHENLSKVEICRLYSSFEELATALDSCWDLHELGCCDESTQKQYEELAEMKVLDAYAWWMKSKGDVNFIDYPYSKVE